MASRGQPLFLVVEGLDGTGTTTVAGMLADALRARDLRVCLTAEPTGGAFGQLLRRHLRGEVDLDPSTAALVFTADRADHLTSLIRPALSRGESVVSDRYLLSTLAYQGALGADVRAVLAASSGFDVPDVTFVLDAPAELRQSRMAERETTERYEDPSLATRLAAGYEHAIALLEERGDRIERIDASRPVADVLDDVLRRVEA